MQETTGRRGRAAAVSACIGMVVAGAPATAYAATPKPRELVHMCAGKTTGLVRPVGSVSACRETERAYSLPEDGPVRLCTSGGFVRRASACDEDDPRFTLPGTSARWFCQNQRFSGFLRKVFSAGKCGDAETVWVVSVPTGRPDDYAVNEDAALGPAAPGVLGDDGDAHGDPLKAVLVAGPAHESAFTLRADGSFTYKPAKNYTGPDSFTYKASDGTYRSQATTVRLSVRPVNDAPSFTAGPDQTVAEDSGVKAVDNWATGISRGPGNESSQTLSFAVTANTNPGLFAAGPAVSPAGRLTFTPAAGKSGTATVTLVLSDDGGTANGGDDTSEPKTFTVTVDSDNEAPVAVADSYGFSEDGAAGASGPGVLDNDTDADGEGLTATLVDGPEHASTFSLAADGTFTYEPDADYCGPDSFTYRAGDGVAQSAPATVSLTVTCVNDAPSFTKGQDVTVDQDSGPQTVDPWATAVEAGPANEAGQALTFAVTGNTNPGMFAAGPAVSPDGVLTFTPKSGAHGSADVTVVLSDDGGTAGGGDDTSGPQTFTVTVAHVNAKPAAVGDAYTLGEDSGAYGVTAPGVLGNDTDGDGDALTATLVAGPEHDSAFTLNADGSFSYTAEADFCGPDSFTYRAGDGTDTSASATVTLIVTCADDGPDLTTTAGNASYGENDPAVVVDPDLALTEPDGDEITGATVAITANAAAGDVLSSTDQSGISGSFAGGTLTLTGTASVAAYRAVLRTVAFRSTSESPSTATRTLTFTVTDADSLSDTATRGVAVSAVNDAPTAAADAGTTDENTTLSVGAPGVLDNDTDADAGDTKTVSKLNGSATLSGTSTKGAAVVINANGAWSYDPGSVFAGLQTGESETDTFTYTMVDSAGAASTATVTVTVNGISVAPVAVADTFDAVGNTGLFVGTDRPVGQAGKKLTGSLLANDTDADTPHGELVVEAVTNAPTTQGGTVTVGSDGTFTYHPDDGDTAVADTFTYRVCDTSPCASGTVGNATGTVTLNLAGQVWYVNNEQAAGGDGTSDTPFDTLAEAESASSVGDTVYVYAGDGTSAGLGTGYVMEPGETLLGAGRPFTLDPDGAGPKLPVDLSSGDADLPKLAATDEDVVVLASGSVLEGVFLDPSGAGGGVFGGAGVSNVTIHQVYVHDDGTKGTQPALELDGTAGGISVGESQWLTGGSPTAIGVRLNNAGTVTFLDGTFIVVGTTGSPALVATGTTAFGAGSTIDSLSAAGSTAGGLVVDGPTGNLAVTAVGLSTTSGPTAALRFNSPGALTVGGGNVTAVGGPAVDVANGPGSSLTLGTVSSTNSAGDGVNLTGLGAGTFTATGGTLANATGTAFNVSGGSGAVTYPGAITDGPGASSVRVASRTGGTVTLSGTITDDDDTGGGVSLTGNTGGATVLSGSSKVLNTGASAALSMGSSDGHTLTVSGGGLDVDATSGAGIDATSSGTIVVTGSNNTVDTVTGRAVRIQNTDIGAAGVVLRSVSANGAANGILLDTTAAQGGLTVSGSGGNCATTADACTGGTIQNTTGDAVSLTSTRDVSLTRMKVRNNLGNGIRGSGVTNFALSDSVVDNNADDAATDEAGLHFTNLAGTASVVRSVVANSPEDNARIVNTSGTLAQLSVTDSTFRDTDTLSPGNNGLLIQADGGSITADVLGSTFQRNRANGLQVITNGTGTVDVEVDDSASAQSTFSDNYVGVNIAHNGSGGLSFDVRDLTMSGTAASASPINVNLAGLATSAMSGTISGNTLTNANSLLGPGIRVVGNGTATATVAITGNSISSVANRGIEVIARDGSNRINATVTDNNVTLTDPAAGDAIRVDSGAVSSDTTTVCADIRNNSATTVAGLYGVRVRQRFTGTSFILEDYAGSATGDAAVGAFLTGLNNSATASADHGGAGFTTTADCPVPS